MLWILVSQLAGKQGGQYFFAYGHERCDESMPFLVDAYEKLKEKGQNFEISMLEEHFEQLEEQLKEEAKGWHEKLKHELNVEPKLVGPRHITYSCNSCDVMGYGWYFFCECDLYPKCALKNDKGAKEGKEGWLARNMCAIS